MLVNFEAEAVVEESRVPTAMPRTGLALVLCSILVLEPHMPRSFLFLFYTGWYMPTNNLTSKIMLCKVSLWLFIFRI